MHVHSTAAPIQVYFGFRVWKLSKSRTLFATMLLLSLANTILGLVGTIFAFTHAAYVFFVLP